MKIIDGMLISAWVATTVFEGQTVTYGPFPSRTEAESWARHLVQGAVEPVYYPSFNRG